MVSTTSLCHTFDNALGVELKKENTSWRSCRVHHGNSFCSTDSFVVNEKQLLTSTFPFPLSIPFDPFPQVSHNQITYITAGSLRQLGNLTRLTRLRMLTLKGNRLSRLPPNLPPSLIHLDVSANCISTLDLSSLGALVNLQVLKINSNCLRSIPERAFDGLSRLRSVELANNQWVCECDILHFSNPLLSFL
uniref:Si:ch211-191d15.2 n=1 Tax=Sinocyclocheilus rhinocerous TaxID=307959 RepID=A0A673FJI8_9TELE